MGREVRRVPVDWQHPRYTEDDTIEHGRPRNWIGKFIPMMDTTFHEAVTEWHEGREAWLRGEHEYQEGAMAVFVKDGAWYEDEVPFPCKHIYRPEYTSEPTAYQMYETVSEGTPTTPVFETPEKLAEYLAAHGDYSHQKYPNDFGKPTYEQAMALIDAGSAPSLSFVPGVGVLDSYQSAEELQKGDGK